ncbi:cytochrome c biogenesis protein [Dethiobacter alkaliphilus]|uniref:Heme exporter protein C n=1 Tax=Dethiobacter alkaliphilus AHT 1 TaxID=555088 RepID=C0GG64_DETAL|nr:cytochrome c biogenesis protein CcsA [Dethiobacter alkaliphilus]EEG77753.1 cytochrome c assembly protein [Dethiobacter alkaliphilus AHT 1]
MIWQVILGLWMTAVVIASFVYVPAIPGFGATGETARIIIYHVPAAWVAVLAYLMAMVNSIGYLKKGDIALDRKAQVNAELGTIFCVLATVTGAIWSHAAWGVYWNWDPRQTSIAVLLMIYAAYFVLRSAIPDSDRRARLSAVYSILAFITVPFLVFIVPRIYYSLHPDLIGAGEGVSVMSGEVLVVFLASLAGFTALYAWMYKVQVRLENLLYKQAMKRGA